jgi:IS30 family transposase
MGRVNDATRAKGVRILARPGVRVTLYAVLEPCAVKVACTVLRGLRFREGVRLPNYPTDPTQQVSHETIYTAIYAQPRGELRRQLIACLRHGHSTRMPRTRGTDRRGQIPDMVSIHVRPPEIEDRLLPGHWEGDFIKGAGNHSSVGVLVERTSRLVLLAKMEDATAASALAGFSAKLNSIVAPLRQSFTYDQGKEMSRHKELAAATGVNVYFCDPHSPWQRGTCETPTVCCVSICPKA